MEFEIIEWLFRSLLTIMFSKNFKNRNTHGHYVAGGVWHCNDPLLSSYYQNLPPLQIFCSFPKGESILIFANNSNLLIFDKNRRNILEYYCKKI